MRRSTSAALATAMVLIASSCGQEDLVDSVRSDSNSAPATTTDDLPATIVWEPLGDDLEEGRLRVPIDADDPASGEFDLYMVRHLATDRDARIGTLLVNPGGPGFGGSVLAENAAFIYGDQLLERFDILGWDPRGTGRSEPAIDCIEEYDPYFGTADITPDDPAERQQIVDAAIELTAECTTDNASILQHVGTNSSAADIDRIRQALGEDTISYFGFSYGSELGAAWATLYPDTVRAAVLDGASDPTSDRVDRSLQQIKGFETSLSTFLARCSADDECAFHNGGDAEGAFDALMLELDEAPLPTSPDRTPVTRSVALTGVIQAMYDDAIWPTLEQSLADAQDGNGEGLLGLYDQYYQRQPDGTYDNSLEAFTVIFCMDATSRLTVEEEDALVDDYRAVAPRLAPGTTGSYQCTFFPEAIDPRVTITGAGAGPILVMGTTGDPATPFESTVAMADTLEDGRLVVVTADQHTGYGVNACSMAVVDDYLVDPIGAAPTDGFECS